MIRREARRHYRLLLWLATVPLYLGAIGRYGMRTLVLMAISLLTGWLLDQLARPCLAATDERGAGPTETIALATGHCAPDADANAVRPPPTGAGWPGSTWLWWWLWPLLVPIGVPWWMVPAGLAFALVIGVYGFGGYGHNRFNVLALGVIFLQLSWPALFSAAASKPFPEPWLGFRHHAANVPLAGPVLTDLRTFRDVPIGAFLRGEVPGALGESYPVLLGVLALLATGFGLIDWRWLLALCGGIALSSWFGARGLPQHVLPPTVQFLAGSVPLGFGLVVAADPFAQPRTRVGRWLGGGLVGMLTVMIRAFSGFGEGVYFALLIGGAVTPAIDELAIDWQFRPTIRPPDRPTAATPHQPS